MPPSSGSIRWAAGVREHSGSVGREQMTQMLQRLRQEGTGEVLLTVDPGNESAMSWCSTGTWISYRPGRPREDYVGPGEARLRMRLTF